MNVEIKESIFAEIGRLSTSHGAINLAQGFPDFIQQQGLDSLSLHVAQWQSHQYTDPSGTPQLKATIAKMMADFYSIDLSTDDNLVVTTGATQAIFSTIAALLGVGDEAIIIEPCFECYAPAISYAGATAKRIQLSDKGRIDFDQLREAITDRVKLVIVNNPHNPMGYCWSQQDMETFENLILEKDIWVLSDEVYHAMVYSPAKHICMWERGALRDKSIVVGSVSKTLGATGWRIGYAIAPEQVIRKIVNMQQYMTYSTNTLFQLAAASVLDNSTFIVESRMLYQRKRDLFLDGLTGSRFKCTPAAGTIFQALDYSEIDRSTSREFCLRLLREHRVASVPLSAFMHDACDMKKVRFCFAKSEETLRNATAVLSQL